MTRENYYDLQEFNNMQDVEQSLRDSILACDVLQEHNRLAGNVLPVMQAALKALEKNDPLIVSECQ